MTRPKRNDYNNGCTLILPKRTAKFKRSFNKRKVMATDFWDRLLVEFVQCENTINRESLRLTDKYLNRQGNYVKK